MGELLAQLGGNLDSDHIRDLHLVSSSSYPFLVFLMASQATQIISVSKKLADDLASSRAMTWKRRGKQPQQDMQSKKSP